MYVQNVCGVNCFEVLGFSKKIIKKQYDSRIKIYHGQQC